MVAGCARVERDEPFSRETLRGGALLAGRYGLGVVAGLANMLVMTWWIGPHAYGVFVTAISLVAFLSSVARAGVDTYLVRSQAAPDDSEYGTANTIILTVSLTLGALAVASVPLLTRWYGGRELVAPYLVLLLTIPVSGLTGIPMAKLERQLRFGKIAGIELSGQTAGLVCAVPLAWLRAGVWAPVVGQIAWQGSTLAATAMAAQWTPRLRWDWQRARSMLSFGLGMTASLRTWQLRTLVNPLLVGKFAGAEGVAFVALAVRIAESLGTFRLAVGRMAIAALARLQDRSDRFRGALEQALWFQVITLGPLLCGFSLLGPFLLPHMIGARWTPSLAVYPFIAAGVLLNSVYNLQASALFVLGQQWLVMRSYGAHIFLLAVGTLALAPRLGIAAYGWAELLACSSYAVIHIGLARSAPITQRRIAGLAAFFVAVLFLPALVHSLSVPPGHSPSQIMRVFLPV